MRRMASGLALAWVMAVAVPTAVFAQTSGIAGVVKDTSGAVMPGVTVEASSPALIERVRTVITDAQGQYKIVDLRPGTYTVSFTLPGFATVKREGIELPATFVATVNTDLRVGALEETVTVSGASPVVDMQNVIKRQVVAKDTIDAMPTSKNWSTIGVMTIGVSSNQNDVGGSAGEHQNQLKAHGGSFNDRIVQLDGLMNANMACNYSCTGISTNDASTQELSYEFGAISAEVAGGGVRVNIIGKDGGNRFSGSGFFNFANDKMQGNNVDDTLRGQGILTADSILKIYDASGALGGPIVKDRLWFWTAHRYWGYQQIRTNTFYEKDQSTFVFTPDFTRPGTETQRNVSDDVRLTWQMTPKNKLSGYFSIAPRKTEHWTLVSTLQPDASNLQNLPKNNFETLTFRSTLSSKALFEAAMGNTTETWTREPVEDSLTSHGYPVTELNTGISFRAYPNTFSSNYTSLRSYRSSLTYVTGSHAFKTGMTLQEGPADTDVYTNKDTFLTVRNGQPFSVTVRTTPYTTHERLVADLGVYAQDTWTIKRMTINAGLRWDYLNNKVGVQDAPGGTWIGPRHFDELSNVPNFKDLSPRLGIADDLFGNGKTAVKATLSRYVQTSTVGFARLLNPLNTSVNTATRSWTDTNTDGIPQLSELGPLSNNAFGQVNIATRYDPATVQGFDSRRNNWEVSTTLSHELMSRVSAEVSYFRRAQGHFTTTDNLDVAPGDFQVLRHRAERLAPAERRRQPDLRPLRHRAGEVRRRDQQPGDLRRQLREADRGVQRGRRRRQRARPVGPAVHRRFRDRQHALQRVRRVRGQPANRLRPVCRGGGGRDGALSRYRVGVLVLRLRHELARPGEGDRVVYAPVAEDSDRRRAAEPARTADHRAVEHHSGRRRGRHARARAVGRREHVARGAAHQAGDDVHAAPDAGRSARLEEHRPARLAEAPGHGRHLQRLQLERRGGRHVERRRTAGSDQHDVRIGVAEAAEHPAGAVREGRRAVHVLKRRAPRES